MITLLQGDCREVLKTLPGQSAQCCVTSPPYFGLRRYDVEGAQIGMEQTPAEYVEAIVEVFRHVRRVLRDDGTLWLNLGDSYSGSGKGGNPPDSPWAGFVGNPAREGQAKTGALIVPGLADKNLIGIPWRVAFALQDDGWVLRSDIIWHKPNPMPEPVKDRPTRSHEYLFLFSKQTHYYYDADAIRESFTASPKRRGQRAPGDARRDPDKRADWPSGQVERRNPAGRNSRSVWTVATYPYPDAHFATFPEQLIEPCILAGSRPGDTVLDPFVGSGTTCRVAERFGRNSIGIDLGYLDLQERRTDGVQVHMEAFL